MPAYNFKRSAKHRRTTKLAWLSYSKKGPNSRCNISRSCWTRALVSWKRTPSRTWAKLLMTLRPLLLLPLPPRVSERSLAALQEQQPERPLERWRVRSAQPSEQELALELASQRGQAAPLR